MADRRERIILELDDRYTGPLGRAAVATKAFGQTLDSASGRQSKLSRDTRQATVDLDRFGLAAKRADSSINQLTGRLRVIADIAAVFGPSLIPISAIGIPAVTGLAQQMGFAVLGAGSLVVAFQGVGDALKAVNDAALEPTAENIEKAREAMAAVGPEAQAFVTRFQELRPVLDGIRDASAAGWFPGLTESLDHFQEVAPWVADLFEKIGRTGGGLVAEGAEAFAGPEWDDFRNFITSEASPALDDLGRTIGNVAAGLAEMWMAFAPLNRDFSDWLLDASRGFKEWSEELSGTQGFAEFVDYIRTNGPRVADALKAVGDAVLQIIEALAPLGGPSLQIIEAFSKAIGAIADSDLGTPIFAAVAALSAYNRALRVTQALNKSMGTAAGGAFLGYQQNLTSMRSNLPSIGQFGTAMAYLGQSSQFASKKTLEARAAVGKFSAQAARAAAPVAGAGLVMSGLGDSMGLSNTAAYALMGTMAGPWGAAVGAAAGLVVDITSATRDWEAAQVAANQAIESGDLSAMTTSLSDYTARLADLKDAQNVTGVGDFFDDLYSMAPWSGESTLFQGLDDQIDETSEGADELRAAISRAQAQAARKQELAVSRAAWSDMAGQAKATADEFFNLANAIEKPALGLEKLDARMENQAALMRDYAKNVTTAIQNGVDPEAIQKVYDDLGVAGGAKVLDQLASGGKKAAREFNRSFNQADTAARRLKGTMIGVGDAALDGATDLKVSGNTMIDVLRRAKKNFDSLPDDVQTDIRANGIPQTKKAVDELEAKYKLTEKQRQALITLKDLATDRIQAVLRQLAAADGKNATTTITTVQRTVRIVEDRSGPGRSTNGGIPQGSADGGTVPKDARPYGDRYHYLLAPGEEVISNRYGQADRHRELLKAINSGRLADGGTVRGREERRYVRSAAPPMSTSPRGGSVATGPFEVTGTVMTQFGPGELVGMARAVAREEIEENEVWNERRARRA